MQSDTAPFPPRDGAGVVILNDKAYIIGGWSPNNPVDFPGTTSSDVWSTENGTMWTKLTVAPFEGRHTAGYIAHNSWIYVLGGDSNRGYYQPDIWRSVDGINWEFVSNAPWGERVLHITYSHNNAIFVIGGQKILASTGEEPTFYDDVWRSDDDEYT